MKNYNKVGLLFMLGTVFFWAACSKPISCDLAIQNVNVFDPISGEIWNDKSILINADTIAGIISADIEIQAKEHIEGKGRLLTPGFIDTHIHLTDLYGDYENAPEYLLPDSEAVYRKLLADTYLPHGVTTVFEAGQSEKWLAMSMNWQKNSSPDFPNFYNRGGAMISDEEREPYKSHVELASPEAARAKVQEYHDLGIRHLKLYWRLREPEMKAVLEKAAELDMEACGHIDQNIVSIQTAMGFGLRHFEHWVTTALSIFSYEDHYADLVESFELGDIHTHDETIAMMVQMFGFIENDPKLKAQMDSLMQSLAHNQTSFSTTIHLLASPTGKTYFYTSANPDANSEEVPLSNYSRLQKTRLAESFDLMMSHLKKAHDLGVQIRIGTDCREGGKAMLSEFLLLEQAGFSVAEVLRIATWNGARAMGIEDRCGSIAVGRQADLVIFEENPFENASHFLSSKTVIKGGRVLAAGG